MTQKKNKVNATRYVRLLMRFFLLSTVWTFAACTTVGPDYMRPDMSVPGAWQKDIQTASKT